ncbi:UNVERIFIED_CONTAM: hypothetical protein Sradi_3631500 [Sesamum radiatum]|uniref:DDE Tnp4 domain-containing protein n=1 Tax=Sesamum radiatum TaxID=300843 RepID=A0AAW2QHZ0_SESRA
MASTSEGASHDNDSSIGTPGTPGSPGSNESDVPEEFYFFKDLICPKLFWENVPVTHLFYKGKAGLQKLYQPLTRNCIGAKHRSRKGCIAQNVLAICDFDMNFTYAYERWEGSTADARVLDDTISQDRTFMFPPSGKYYLVDAGFANYQCFLAPYRGTRYHLAEYRGQDPMTYAAYLTRAGFPQEEHWSLEMERRLMWMILDTNAAIPMSDDQVAEGQMAYWSRAMRRHGGYPYTREQIRAKFYEFKDTYRTFHALTQVQAVAYDCNTMWIVVPNSVQEQITRHDDNRSIGYGHSPGDRDSPIVISDSIAPSAQTHTHVGSWDEESQVANATEGARPRRTASIGPQRSVDMGSGTGDIGSWTDYIRRFGLGSSRGGRTASEGDSTARSRPPRWPRSGRNP